MSTEVNKVLAPMSGGDVRRWVLFAQVALAIGVWWALANIITLFYRGLAIPIYRPFGWHDANWVAFAITGAAFIYTLRNVVAQEFANDVFVELRKVTWPSRKEVQQSTIVVIITVAVVGSILGLFDLLWSQVTKYLLTSQIS